MGLSSNLSCEAGSFSCCCPAPTSVFNQRFEALFPCAGALGCVVCFAPRCSSGLSVSECGASGCHPPLCLPRTPPLQVRPSSLSVGMRGCRVCQWSDCLPRSSHTPPVSVPPRPRESSLPLLPFWMNVYFFIYLVLDFLAVPFSVSSGCARRRSVSTYAAILLFLKTQF